MIIELIKKCFEKNGFEVGRFDDCWDFAWESFIARRMNTGRNTKSEFFIIIDKKNATEDDLDSLKTDGTLGIFKAAQKHPFYNEMFDKNATLLICFNGKSPNSTIISQIEEDPYNFRKNILRYSNEQLNQLDALLNNEESYSVEELNKALNNAEKFTEMKKEAQDTGYTLLVHLFVKLPFLKYETDNQIKLDNLDEKIQNQLKEKKLFDLSSDAIDLNWDKIASYDQLPETFKNISGGDDD